MRNLFSWTFGIIFGLAFFWLIIMKLISRLTARFGLSGPCPASLNWLVDNRIRRRYMRLTLDRVNIQPGETILELGPGPGVFTVEAALRAGPNGHLIAVDIQPKMVNRVKQRVHVAGLNNVEIHLASAYDLPLPDASVDRAFLVTVLMEIPEPNRALKELHRVLKPGGVLSITEEFMDPDYPFASETLRRVEAAGFQLMQRYGNTWVYTINFQRTTLLDPALIEVLACPDCHGSLDLQELQSGLYCAHCAKLYPIHQGIPHFIELEELTGFNLRFARMYDWFSWIYRLYSKIAFAVIGMSEERGRREVTDRLQPTGGRVLEVSIGPGVNLPYLANRADVGEVFGLDISLGQLNRCHSYASRNGWKIPLFLGNAEALPFKDNSFEAVFHIGGINFFNDKHRAIQEMIRVAKPGARILICDENEKGARGYELTIPGFKRRFGGQRPPITPPIDSIPMNMQELRVFDVWKGWMYCIEFVKPNEQLKFNLM